MHGQLKLWRRVFILATCAILGMALIGCQDGGDVFREIDSAFTGPYVGIMLPEGVGGFTRQDTIDAQAAIEAVVTADGRVIFTITSINGVFTATGGVRSDDSVLASGVFNGARIVFTGTLVTNDFGLLSGSWVNQRTGATGTWGLAQQGVSVINVANGYIGTFTAGAFSGRLSFSIDAFGDITGEVEVNDTPVTLSGGVNENLVLVMTGTYQGQAIYFIGTVNTTERSASGLVGIEAGGGVTGSWTADVPSS